MKWLLGACPACGGALYMDGFDQTWFTCLLCARSFELQRLITPALNRAQGLAIEARGKPTPAATGPRLEAA